LPTCCGRPMAVFNWIKVPVMSGAVSGKRRNQWRGEGEVFACSETMRVRPSQTKVDDAAITVVCNGVPETYVLPDPIGRRMISRFVHKYKVRVEYFYHPEMIPKLSETEQ